MAASSTRELCVFLRAGEEKQKKLTKILDLENKNFPSQPGYAGEAEGAEESGRASDELRALAECRCRYRGVREGRRAVGD